MTENVKALQKADNKLAQKHKI